MFNRNLRVLPALALALALVLSIFPFQGLALADNGVVTLTSLMQDDAEPVTFYNSSGSQISSLDPQYATDQVSITPIENLFLGLTNVNPYTTEIEAEVATEWSYDADTITWTFTLRDDIPWVRWDPVAEEATVLRNVVAQDFVNGIRRMCDPNNTSLYTEVVGSNIAGCTEILEIGVDDFDPAMLEEVGVSAPDDTTLEITLAGPRGYFFPMSSMWPLRAIPQEILDEAGDEWTEPGNIVTNGAYMLDEWVRGVRRVFIANPFFPADLRNDGNVERVIYTFIEDGGTTYALYQDGQLDVGGVPGAELQNVLNDPDLSAQAVQTTDLAVFYFGFGHDKAPFDNVHARRAFSAAVNRELFVSEVRSNQGIPMMHFVPPGMFGAAPVNEVGINGEGIGYDPDFALSEMEAAGYPNCEGFPELNVVTYTGAGTWAEFIQAEVENNLGCDPGLFSIEQLEFSVLLQVTTSDTPTEERPNMWTLGWGPDYPDANNWVYDAGLHCESSNDFMRPCDEVDELILQAQEEGDPDTRLELYAQIEEMFFGYEGLHPIMPLYLRAGYTLIQPWAQIPLETDGLFGGSHWDTYSIDVEAQTAGRAGE